MPTSCAARWARKKWKSWPRSAKNSWQAALRHKVPAKKAEKIFDLMEEFGRYGFPKAHACAYALLAYQTAYLKVHYPVEFMAAMLSSEAGNTEKVVKYINEARGMGIRVLPPVRARKRSVLHSRRRRHTIRPRGHQECRREHRQCDLRRRARPSGSFRSLFEFCEAIEPKFLNKRVLESLVKAGAFDCLGGGSRGRLFAAIDQAISRGQKKHQEKTVGQHGLFLSGRAKLNNSIDGRTANFPKRTIGPKSSVLPVSIPSSAFTFPAILSINMPAA